MDANQKYSSPAASERMKEFLNSRPVLGSALLLDCGWQQKHENSGKLTMQYTQNLTLRNPTNGLGLQAIVSNMAVLMCFVSPISENRPTANIFKNRASFLVRHHIRGEAFTCFPETSQSFVYSALHITRHLVFQEWSVCAKILSHSPADAK